MELYTFRPAAGVTEEIGFSRRGTGPGSNAEFAELYEYPSGIAMGISQEITSAAEAAPALIVCTAGLENLLHPGTPTCMIGMKKDCSTKAALSAG